MTPVTSNGEPPAKKLRLSIKMPDDVANRAKMPLHILKDIFRYFVREEMEALRLVCRFWSRCVATRPPHFRQLFKLDRFVCDWYEPDDPEAHNMDGIQSWLEVERPLNCCGHLRDLASKMAGKLFIPVLAADVYINIEVKQPIDDDEWIGYLFRNKLTKKTAFPLLHFLNHLREVAFTVVWNRDGSFFSSSVHPDVVQLFCPMHCRELLINLSQSELNIPSLKSLTDAIKHQEISWWLRWEGTDSSTARVKGVLEQFAIDVRHLYHIARIIIMPVGQVEQHHWTTFFQMIVGLFSKALKDSRQVVPRVDIRFRDQVPSWPLLPFSDMELIHEETHAERVGAVRIVGHILHYKMGGGPDAKTSKAVVKWNEYNGISCFERVTFFN